jgi:O-antigen/teichoic acid export membrane protein
MALVIRATGLRFSFGPRELQQSFRFGLKTHAMTLMGRVHERVDLFLLAYLLADPTQIAFFAIAKGGIQIVQLLPNSLGKVAYPQLAGLERDDAARFACQLVRQGLLFMVPASLALFLAAPLLLPFVYGEPYAASTVPFVLMLPGVVLLGLDRVLSRYFTGTNQQRPNIVTRAVSLAVNVGLNLLWIPSWGIAGAAAAALVSYVVDALLLVAVFVRMTDCGLADLFVLRRGDLEPYLRRLQKLRGA